MPFLSRSTLALALLCSTAKAFSPYGRIASAQRRHITGLVGPLPASTTANTDADADNATANDENDQCGVLLLDHFNINHEKGRHDVLKAFYFDFLGCAIDPRKYDNYLAGKKVLGVIICVTIVF